MAGGHGRRIGMVVPPRIPKSGGGGGATDLHERERQRREKLAEQLKNIRAALSKDDAR